MLLPHPPALRAPPLGGVSAWGSASPRRAATATPTAAVAVGRCLAGGRRWVGGGDRPLVPAGGRGVVSGTGRSPSPPLATMGAASSTPTSAAEPTTESATDTAADTAAGTTADAAAVDTAAEAAVDSENMPLASNKSTSATAGIDGYGAAAEDGSTADPDLEEEDTPPPRNRPALPPEWRDVALAGRAGRTGTVCNNLYPIPILGPYGWLLSVWRSDAPAVTLLDWHGPVDEEGMGGGGPGLGLRGRGGAALASDAAASASRQGVGAARPAAPAPVSFPPPGPLGGFTLRFASAEAVADTAHGFFHESLPGVLTSRRNVVAGMATLLENAANSRVALGGGGGFRVVMPNRSGRLPGERKCELWVPTRDTADAAAVLAAVAAAGGTATRVDAAGDAVTPADAPAASPTDAVPRPDGLDDAADATGADAVAAAADAAADAAAAAEAALDDAAIAAVAWGAASTAGRRHGPLPYDPAPTTRLRARGRGYDLRDVYSGGGATARLPARLNFWSQTLWPVPLLGAYTSCVSVWKQEAGMSSVAMDKSGADGSLTVYPFDPLPVAEEQVGGTAVDLEAPPPLLGTFAVRTWYGGVRDGPVKRHRKRMVDALTAAGVGIVDADSFRVVVDNKPSTWTNGRKVELWLRVNPPPGI